MSEEKKFDPAKRKKLNNPSRLKWIPPENIEQAVQIAANKRYLDIGAGTGYISSKIAAIVPQAEIYALDIEPLMVEEMKNSAHPNGLIPQLMERDLLSFEEASIDGIWSTTVFHELGNPSPLLKEMFRVLRPQTNVLIIDCEKNDAACEHGPPLDHRVSEEAVITAMEKAGFTQVQSVSGFTFHFGILGTKA